MSKIHKNIACFTIHASYEKEFRELALTCSREICDNYDPAKPFALDSDEKIQKEVQERFKKTVLERCGKSGEYVCTRVWRDLGRTYGIWNDKLEGELKTTESDKDEREIQAKSVRQEEKEMTEMDVEANETTMTEASTTLETINDINMDERDEDLLVQ